MIVSQNISIGTYDLQNKIIISLDDFSVLREGYFHDHILSVIVVIIFLDHEIYKYKERNGKKIEE